MGSQILRHYKGMGSVPEKLAYEGEKGILTQGKLSDEIKKIHKVLK